MTIGERIKNRRYELGLTAYDLAKILGVSRSTVYRYENGFIEKLPVDFLEPLSKALQTTPMYIMGWDNKADNTTSSDNDPEIHVFHTYKKLDTEDKAEIRGEMKHMLKADKYKEEKKPDPTEHFGIAAKGGKATQSKKKQIKVPFENDTEFAKGFDMVASGGAFIQSGEDDFETID